MKGFKHTARRFAVGLSKGAEVPIGTFSFYRKMEGIRGDPWEGQTAALSLTDHHFDVPKASDISAASQLGIRIAPRSPGAVRDVTIGPSIVTHTIDEAYIFCCSLEPDMAMIEEHDLACFEISDVAEFGRRMADTRPDILGPAQIAPVRYCARTGDPFLGAVPRLDPFAKAVPFLSEKELRMVWSPRAPGPSFQAIACPAIADLLTPIVS